MRMRTHWQQKSSTHQEIEMFITKRAGASRQRSNSTFFYTHKVLLLITLENFMLWSKTVSGKRDFLRKGDKVSIRNCCRALTTTLSHCVAVIRVLTSDVFGSSAAFTLSRRVGKNSTNFLIVPLAWYRFRISKYVTSSFRHPPWIVNGPHV